MPAPSPPTTVYPICEQLFQVAKEVGGFGVAPSTQSAYTSIPIAGFMPENKVMPWIEDTSYWGDFVKTHDLQQGPIWQDGGAIKDSPLYGDSFPILAYNLLGDLVTTGTAGSPTWVTSGALAAGATAVTVTTGSVAVSGTFIQVDSTSGDTECVIVGTGSTATNIVLNAATPLRFSHLTGVTVTTVTAPFTHSLSLLNPYGSTGVTTGQGPSHAIIHRTGIPGSGNNNSWLFAYSCVSELTISAKATGALTWSGKVTSFQKAYPSFNPVASFSTVRMIPGWNSTTTLASTIANNVADWSVTLTRELDVIPTADGYQQPYLIGRGNLSATFKLNFSPALSEAPLNYMLNNTQPTLAWAISNGGSGAGLISFALNAQLAGFKEAPLQADKTFFGWSTSGELIASTTNAGNSGGRAPCQLVFQNAVPTY